MTRFFTAHSRSSQRHTSQTLGALCLLICLLVCIALPVVGLAAAQASAGAPLALLTLSLGWSYADVLQQGSELGASVSPAGDVNGDGYADVIAGAPKYDVGGLKVGAVLVFYGSGGGLCSSTNPKVPCPPDWQYSGTQKGALLGYSVAAAGDINGDGYDDILVGAPEHKEGLYKTGAAFVFYGSSMGLCSSGGPGCPTPWVSISADKDSLYGYAVARAGDIDGDGYADVLVGAPTLNNRGAVYVYRGSASGLGASPDWILVGEQPGAMFGAALDSAGDTNGDGLDDILIGAPSFDDPLVDAGKVYVFNGSAVVIEAAPAWTASGGQAGARFGISAVTTGDVNQDGFTDLAVGAPLYDTTQPDVGQVFVYYGSAQGFPDAPSWQAESYQPYSWFGFALASAGDLDQDGYADLVVGAHMYDESQPNQQGALFIYPGGPDGLAAQPLWQALGLKSEAYLGKAVAGAGDINGDGFADLVAGAPGFFLADTLVGQAAVYYGCQAIDQPLQVFIPLMIRP